MHQQEGYPIKVISLEPAMKYLWEKYDIGQIPILDDETYNRLVEFAKDGETMLELIDRLLDAATAAQEAKLQSTNNNEADAVLSRN